MKGVDLIGGMSLIVCLDINNDYENDVDIEMGIKNRLS